MFDTSPIHVNVFNISKINSEVRGDKAPRIKRLSEYIGQSYFDYLAGLHDLVLLMDESHRYRATAGVKAINELKPILGLELTATPQVEKGGTPEPFNNVIYSYPLSNAMTDGFVKEPAVATRENFDIRNYDEASLEKLKLEDGVRVHENTKVELEVYARDNSKSIVKPFTLIVAKDVEHANSLAKVIEDVTFFGGRYNGKVITVHSNLKGEEKDETVQQLLSVEDRDNPTEIVIHVNMLKEGWDVTNLYTIIPLRAANSKTLVEQSIGRGLRLPYGKRVGIPAVDRLTIVSHDRFQEIIDEANNPNSIIRTGVVIGRDIPDREMTFVQVSSFLEGRAAADPTIAEQRPLFNTEREQEIARATLSVLTQFERLARSNDLRKPENIQKILERVQTATAPAQGELAGVTPQVDVPNIVSKTIDLFIDNSIDIPRIVVVPKGEVTAGYRAFDLDLKGVQLQPVAKDILIAHLHDAARYRLISGDGIVPEERLEDYIVRGLMGFDDVSYDDHSELLYKLAAAVVMHLQSYLLNENDVRNVLQYHQAQLVNIVHAQMWEHYEEKATEYEASVTKGFTTLGRNSYSMPVGESPRDFRLPVEEKLLIRRGMLFFGGFKRCLYPSQRFQSDPERLFSVLLEDQSDPSVLKWLKPGSGIFQIHLRGDSSYEPDFVVETKTAKLICEIKRVKDIKTDEVQDKANAAVKWCEYATAHEKQNGGKPWSYLLIPDEAVTATKTLQGLAAAYTRTIVQ